MNEQRNEKVLFTMDEEFKFSCHKGLACFNTCCHNINIFLTPYDVLRIRRGTGLSSGEFLEKYTTPLLGDDGMPLLLLKMIEDQNDACPFVASDGCTIYENRPWSCRMFPVFPISIDEQEFLVEPKPKCLGYKEDKLSTPREWKESQDLLVYDKMNQAYKDITRHDYFQSGNKLDQGQAKLLYRACYDLDEFKKFLFQSKFLDIYDVGEEVIEKIKNNEEELLSFGYAYVKSSLFSEGTLKLKDRDMDKLLQSRNKASS